MTRQDIALGGGEPVNLGVTAVIRHAYDIDEKIGTLIVEHRPSGVQKPHSIAKISLLCGRKEPIIVP